MSDKQLAELAGKVAVLEAQVAAQGQLLMAMALAMPESRRIEFLELATALQLRVTVDGEKITAQVMAFFAEQWRAHLGTELQSTHGQMLLAIHSGTQLLASTPAHLRPALLQWLSIATPDEIAQELDGMLPGRPAPGAAADAGEKKRKRGDG